ncbi:MAG: hypothetical protein SFW08_04630 [Gemmatimonadaceae bacterium]|nr:hypothetical protein [Gemmatimonadaceae bacterium]
MTPPDRVRWLWSTAGVAAVGTLVALVFPVSRVPAGVAPRIAPLSTDAAPGTSISAVAPDAGDPFVARNPFHPSRRPPAEREFLTLGDTFPEPSAMSADSGVAPDPATVAEQVPALFGIVDTPSGRRALLRLDAEKTRAALFGVGDGTAGWRVLSIGLDAVTLEGPEGRQVVSLSSRLRLP